MRSPRTARNRPAPSTASLQPAGSIEIRCHRCERYGRLSIARLLREHAPQTPLWLITDALIGGCPKLEAQNLAERCSVYCPDLVRLFLRPTPG